MTLHFINYVKIICANKKYKKQILKFRYNFNLTIFKKLNIIKIKFNYI